jgi:hypothetical protein
MVLFVIGGISYKEQGQVQGVLEQWRREQKLMADTDVVAPKRIILLSTHVLNPENVLHMIFND